MRNSALYVEKRKRRPENHRLRLLGGLLMPQFGIEPILLNQIIVIINFNNLTILDYANSIGITEGIESMCDADDCSTRGDLRHIGHNCRF